MGLKIDVSMLPCGVLVLDSTNNIVEANNVFCSWFGCDRQDVLQKTFNMFFTPASRLLYLGHILPKLQTIGLVEEKYLMLKTASGTELPILMNAHKVQRDGGTFFVFSLMKMLRRHLIEEQLINERRQAEQANAEKDLLNQKLQKMQAELLGKQQQLLHLNENLEILSVTDSLTGLFNRRFYDNELDSKLANFKRTAQKFSLILLDIDFFKSINDKHGHAVGNSVLKTVSSQLKRNLREIDTLARIGGEEFAIILPNCGIDEALITAERHRKSLEDIEQLPYKITASFGVAESATEDNKSSIYKRADNALYLSKSSGRNCVNRSL